MQGLFMRTTKTLIRSADAHADLSVPCPYTLKSTFSNVEAHITSY